MKRILLFSLTVLVLLLSSCELSYERHNPAPKVGTVRIVVYGNDYVKHHSGYWTSGIYTPKAIGTLCAVNDAEQIGYALTSLARMSGVNCECTYIIGDNIWGDDTNPSIVDNIYSFDSSACIISDCSYQKYKQVISELKEKTLPNDLTILFMACHGGGLENKEVFGLDVAESSYIAFSDTIANCYVTVTTSDYYSLIDSLEGIKVVLADFCHSGSLVRQGNVSLGDDEYKDMKISSLFKNYRKNINENSSTYVLTAARYYESSWEKANHGYFTNAILRAVGWKEEEKKIGSIKVLDTYSRLTLLNLANYVILNDGKAAQTPMVSGGSNDIVLFAF